MPTTAPFTKVDRCRKFGANVVLHGARLRYYSIVYASHFMLFECISVCVFMCHDLR